MVVFVALRDDSIEIAVSFLCGRQDGQVVLPLATGREVYRGLLGARPGLLEPRRAAVSLKAEDGLDTRLQRCLLGLEVRANVAVLGEGYGCVP